MCAVRRADHVPFSERAANANCDRFLADAGMEEAGQVARAEAFDDLLLKASDQQHLGQERGELFV